MERINVIILTNLSIIQKLMVNFLERENIKVISTITSIGEIKSVLKQEVAPDIILICTYPSDSCVAHAAAINEIKPGMKYIVISDITDDDLFLQGLSVGIRGWIDPKGDFNFIPAAIEIVAGGGLSIGFTNSVEIILNLFKTETKIPYNTYTHKGVSDYKCDDVAEIARIDLTSREIEVLTLIAEGISNKKISEMLFISENTTKTHVRNILSKLQLQSRTQVALYAIQHGIIENE